MGEVEIEEHVIMYSGVPRHITSQDGVRCILKKELREKKNNLLLSVLSLLGPNENETQEEKKNSGKRFKRYLFDGAKFPGQVK